MKHLFPAAVFLLAAPAMAQISAGITGTVHDPSGAAVPRAQITLTESATKVKQVVTASDAGTFSFTHLNPGTYSLDVTSPGFAHLVRSGVTAIVGDTVSADLVLSVGSEPTERRDRRRRPFAPGC